MASISCLEVLKLSYGSGGVSFSIEGRRTGVLVKVGMSLYLAEGGFWALVGTGTQMVVGFSLGELRWVEGRSV